MRYKTEEINCIKFNNPIVLKLNGRYTNSINYYNVICISAICGKIEHPH